MAPPELRTSSSTRWIACAALTLLACGGAPARPDVLSAEFDAAEIARAREAAPRLMDEADQARQDAAAAELRGDDAAANDERTRARLLLEAAAVRADIADLSATRAAAEQREDAATAEAVRLETTREEEARSLARDLAGDLARQQAREAFAQAEVDEARRAARNAGPVAAARRRAADSLRMRARLVLAAAEVMGASDSDVSRVRQTLASEVDDPVRALAAADGGLSRALALLGRARAARPALPTAERASLEAAARDRGFEVEARPEALVVRVPGIFARGANPTAARLNHFLDLLRAYPRSPITLTVTGEGALARRQLAAVTRALGDSPAGVRVELAAAGSAAPAGTLEALFFTYGTDGPRTTTLEAAGPQ